jgi:hypothetical protein
MRLAKMKMEKLARKMLGMMLKIVKMTLYRTIERLGRDRLQVET